jgi:DNA repair exonuclease SbcCD nuclease subunit
MKSKVVQILLLGDQHNNFSYLIQKILKYNLRNSVMLCVGDFGAYWDDDNLNMQSLQNLNNVLNKNKIELYTIRGNHDNPKNFDNKRIYGNVHLVKDYSVLTFNNYNFLMIGGAISPDKDYRIIKKEITEDTIINDTLFEGEEFILDIEKASKLKNIDIVITHSAPTGVYPHTYVNTGNDKLNKQLLEERQDLAKLRDILFKNNNIQYWFYGHFHINNCETINNTQYCCIGQNDIKPLLI